MPASGEGSIPLKSVEAPVATGMMDGSPMDSDRTVLTSVGEARRVILDRRHKIVMNASTRLSIRLLERAGGMGYLVDLAQGEICVDVEHDGRPFVVRTIHGRAVITGTTFDVKVTDAGTTLVVAEGCVRFESDAGAVYVTAGRRSILGAAAVLPSLPESCDATILTAWARVGQSATEVAQDVGPDGLVESDPPLLLSLRTEVRTDPESIDATQWMEQETGWFKRQFPPVFKLKAALATDGIEVSYTALLLKSPVVWHFAWPPAGEEHLLWPDDAMVVEPAKCHGKDWRWLAARNLLPYQTPDVVVEQVYGPEAFAAWQKEIAAILKAGGAVPAEVLLASVQACDYVRHMRLLVWLAVDLGVYARPEVSDFELQHLLQQQIAAADDSTDVCLQLLVAKRSKVSCDSDAYQELIGRFHMALGRMVAIEGRLTGDKASRQP